MLESLVADNENLKHDNAELQNLLSDAREDVRALQEEVGEHRAGFPSDSTGVRSRRSLELLPHLTRRSVRTPQSKSFFTSSFPSSFKDESVGVFITSMYAQPNFT